MLGTHTVALFLVSYTQSSMKSKQISSPETCPGIYEAKYESFSKGFVQFKVWAAVIKAEPSCWSE